MAHRQIAMDVKILGSGKNIIFKGDINDFSYSFAYITNVIGGLIGEACVYRPKGLTLVELLLSMALMSIIMVSISSLFNTV